jgi:hypothetical protein
MKTFSHPLFSSWILLFLSNSRTILKILRLSVLYFDLFILNFIFIIQLKFLSHGIKSKKSNQKEKKLRMILKKNKKMLQYRWQEGHSISCEGNRLVALFSYIWNRFRPACIWFHNLFFNPFKIPVFVSLFSTIQRSCD